jgi:gluconate 2-dehydrogenase gamma chain
VLLTGCPEDEEEATTTTSTEAAAAGTDGAAEQGSGATFALMSLAVSEAEALQALLARMIPSDDLGPGAVEAGVVRYIDRALASEAAGGELEGFRANLAAVDELARQEQNQRFQDLAPNVQEALVGALETGAAEGFSPGAAQFFAILREFALQGMFGDPIYGGNIDNAGWDLLGYGGVRIDVPAEAQELGAETPEGESSTYNFELFGLQRQEG